MFLDGADLLLLDNNGARYQTDGVLGGVHREHKHPVVRAGDGLGVRFDYPGDADTGVVAPVHPFEAEVPSQDMALMISILILPEVSDTLSMDVVILFYA